MGIGKQFSSAALVSNINDNFSFLYTILIINKVLSVVAEAVIFRGLYFPAHVEFSIFAAFQNGPAAMQVVLKDP